MTYPSAFDLNHLGAGEGLEIVSASSPGPAIGLGDINGDGLADFAIEAADGNTTYVVFGGADLGSVLSTADLDGGNGFTLQGHGHITSAGDFNGDGIGDFMVLSRPVIAYGRAEFDAVLPLPLTLPYADYRDPSKYAAGGYSLGDINGDGFDDIGIYYGDVYNDWARVTLGGPAGATHESFEVGAQAEPVLSFARGGDFNGDGFDDYLAMWGDDASLVFGSADQGSQPIDHLWLHGPYDGFDIAADVRDRTFVGAIGDINGDGFDDLRAGTTVIFGHGGPAYDVVPGNVSGGDGFRVVGGKGIVVDRVHGVGDVNGDGFDDFAFYDTDGKHPGVYVVFGNDKLKDDVLVVSHLNGKNGFEIMASSHGMISIADQGATDLNGDGLCDLIVTGPGADGTPETYVVYGQAPDEAVVRVGTEAGQTLVGGAYADRLSGMGGDDLLLAGAGSDKLVGGVGDDTLVGGSGHDVLIGGEGADVFRFVAISDSLIAKPDLIRDMEPGDLIDLSATDADIRHAGDQAFHLVSGFTAHPGELRIAWSPTTHRTSLEGDVNGDGLADFTIDLRGRHDPSDIGLVL